MLSAALLDVDGTLIDTNDAHAGSYREALAEAGYDIPYFEVRWRIGMGGDRLVPELTGLNEKDPAQKQTADAIRSRHKELFLRSYLPSCKTFPRVRELLSRLKSEGLKLIVATSAASDEVGAILKHAGVDDLVDEISSGSDARSSKPAPDIVEAALKRGHVSPHDAVMIGDTPYDIAAAHRAGLRVIALTCGGWKVPDLEQADEIYRDPADLLAHLDKSLLASSPGTAPTHNHH
jgi:HAD superfamily hydrolase (TIGR01509 family)